MKKIGWVLLIVLIISVLALNFLQWEILDKKISDLSAKISTVTKDSGTAVSSDSTQKNYEITIDMWQIFEKELQDYKQRIKEGKQYYDEQKTGWNTILTDLKKSLQEYDKFVSAEGEFWEKQLKNYDKLLARTEERFDLLGQAIDELRAIITDMQNLKVVPEIEEENKEQQNISDTGKEVIESDLKEIKPQIRGGGGEYKTYPAVEEKGSQDKGKSSTVRGTITGSGDYKTY